MERPRAAAPHSQPFVQSPLSKRPAQSLRYQETPTWLYQRPPGAPLRASAHRGIWLSFESTAPLFTPWFCRSGFSITVVFATGKCPQQRFETSELLQPANELNRLFGIFARQHEVGAVAKLVAKFGPAHGFLRMSAGNVATAF